MCRYSAYIESALFLILFFTLKSQTKYAILLLVYAGYMLFRAIQFSYRVWNSKNIIRYDAENSRIQCIEGANGRGKSSFGLYSASVLQTPVLSNVPAKINNKFVYCLTKDHLLLIMNALSISVLLLIGIK